VTKTESFDGQDYTLATITAGTAKKISLSSNNGVPLENHEFNTRLVAASLIAGGHDDGVAITDSLPIFDGSTFGRFLNAALEVNGLKVEAKEPSKGEGQAEASPAAESTGDSSTED